MEAKMQVEMEGWDLYRGHENHANVLRPYGADVCEVT